MKTLNDYAIEVHKANQKWWLDLERPCERCKATGIDPVDESETRDNYSCSECNGLGYAKKERNLGEMLMLAVSELSEALEGHRKNLPDDKLPHRSMVEVELADFIIRMLDTAAGIGVLLPDRACKSLNRLGATYKANFILEDDNFGANLLIITGICSEAYRYRDHDKVIWAIQFTLVLAYSLGLDIEGAYVEKMAFNAKREDHTIAHRLSAQGKKY